MLVREGWVGDVCNVTPILRLLLFGVFERVSVISS